MIINFGTLPSDDSFPFIFLFIFSSSLLVKRLLQYFLCSFSLCSHLLASISQMISRFSFFLTQPALSSSFDQNFLLYPSFPHLNAINLGFWNSHCSHLSVLFVISEASDSFISFLPLQSLPASIRLSVVVLCPFLFPLSVFCGRTVSLKEFSPLPPTLTFCSSLFSFPPYNLPTISSLFLYFFFIFPCSARCLYSNFVQFCGPIL